MLDSFYNYGQIYRSINSTLFMLVSLALLYRITKLKKSGRTEGYIERIRNLESRIEAMQHEAPKSTAPKA
jgi:hypothetical protein